MKLSKSMTNLDIAELLRDVAAAYQLKDEKKQKFKIIAYQRAADAVEHASSELKDLWDEGKLKDVPGIGESIADHLDEVFKTGKSKHFEEVTEGLPPSMFELMTIPGIGAKRAFRLAKELKINSITELEGAAKAGKIEAMEGFGNESQSDILKAIEESKGKVKRNLLPYAAQVAHGVIEWMLKDKNVKRIEPLGSLRRQASTVGDIDIACSTNSPVETLEHFTKYPGVQRIIEKGSASSSVIIPGGLQVDLMVQPPEAFGALLQHFTGSKHHNIALREYAIKHNMSLSEYGIKIKGKLEKIATEEEFYKKLGMDYIPPELREDTGEIEAALAHKIPKLIELKDVKADLQIHSDFDIETSHDVGTSSMEDIVRKANELKYEYIAFTEHNPSKSKHSEEQILELLRKKKQAVEKLNYSFVKSVKGSCKKVFNSLEIDILPDGKLPISDRGFELIDFALVSIHSSFGLPRDEMTRRVLSGLNHPKVKIFAHPSARKLNDREGIDLNWSEIFEFCKTNNKWIEVNADPARLDLPDNLVREALKFGVKFTFGTDSHHVDSMNNMTFGVSVARRGWATESDIMNTRSLSEFEKLIGGD